MKKLRKQDRRQFDEVCRTIRDALHLEHWESRYTFEPSQPEDRRYMYAQNRCYQEGRKIWIGIYPAFFDLSAEEQATTLIHEHIHALHNPYEQMVGKIIDWSHEADRRWAEMVEVKLNEHVTDHLTAVVYDLIKDRL